MAHLDIAFLTGDSERRELSKQQPVSIGSYKSNDIVVDEKGVELIHCRISWNKSAFEAVAAGVEPIDVNGNLQQRAVLKSGDVVRIGSVDITFAGEGAERGGGAAAPADESTFGLKPVTGDLPSFLSEPDDDPVIPPKRTASKPRAAEPPATPKKAAKPAPARNDDDWMKGMSGLAAESQPELPAHRPRSQPAAASAAEPDVDELDELEEPTEQKGAAAPVVSDRLRTALHNRRDRPGDEDTLRSPVVLGLGGLAITLLLLAGVFYFVGARRSTQEEFDAARAVFDEGKYAQAITQLTEFANKHHGDPLEETALMLAGLAGADRHLSGAVKDWPKGLEALKTFINDARDYDGFEEQHAGIAERATRIARGGAEAAGKTFDRSLLKVSDDAVTLVTTYTSKDTPPTELVQEVASLRRQSEAAILEHETFDTALAAVTAALNAKDPIKALEIRRDLLVRYPEFASDKRLDAQMQATLTAEAQRVVPESIDRPAATDAPASSPAPLSLAFFARSRTDVVSVNEAVCVLAKDCVYGVDTVTGAPRWRHVIGLNTPFFPVREPGTPSLITFDTRSNELLRLQQNTGELLWRQTLGEPASGPPLLDEGQLYVPLLSGALVKVDLQSGAASTRVQFSQSISAPVALTNGSHLVVAGDRDVVYTLTKQPLECVGVSYLAQKPGSIAAPLVAIGPYVLLGENTGARTCTLRLLQASDPLHLQEIAAANVAGSVLDLPVIRGRDLFVPSSGERVAAFTISDDAGQPPLIAGPNFQVQGGGESTSYLATGPDRQLWMAGSALRKLQLTTNALEADQKVVAVGLSTQPLQYVGGTMFNARQRPYTSAVTFTQTNREELTSDWQAVVGARIITSNLTPGDKPALLCVTEAGHIFRTLPAHWQQGGFFGEAVRLPLSDELREPIHAVPFGQGQLAVTAGGSEPKLWLISRLGQIDASYPLDAPLQAAPVPLGNRFLLPVAGKLQLSSGSGQPPVEAYSLPSDQAATIKWRQVLGIDEQNAVAITQSGQVLQIRQQSSPRSHLAEVTRIELEAPVEVQSDARDGRIAIADVGQQVRVLDALTLDAAGRRTLDAPVSNDVWLVGDALFVETAASSLHCLDLNAELTSRWQLDLNGAGLAGRPLKVGDSLLIALVDGRVQLIAAATGEVQKELTTGCRLSGAPVNAAGEWLVPSLDGSLIRVTEIGTP
ncbi:MAG: PQQ-binding-like beta-propeller repeat protein [Planctomycetaceae bacterium]|nr:PQQ-binding-like beta-propeller repeat protein [Planctomycetaceae bacterium]